MNENEIMEGLKWLEEHKFTKGDDGKWRRRIDTVSVNKNDWARLKAEGKNYTGEVVQSLDLTISLVRMSSGLSGWQCSVAITRKDGNVSASIDETPDHAFINPEAAIKHASQLFFMELWHVLAQIAKYAKFKIEYENMLEEDDE